MESIPYENLPMLRRNGLREMTLNPHDNPSDIINTYNANSVQEALFSDIQQPNQNDYISYNYPSRSQSQNLHQSYKNIHPQSHIPKRHVPSPTYHNIPISDSEEFMKFLNRTLTYSPIKIFKDFIVSLNRKLSACCEKCRVDIFKVFENSSDYSVAETTTESPTEKVKCDVMDFLRQLYEVGKKSDIQSTTSTTTPLPTTTSTVDPISFSRENIKPAMVELLHRIYALSRNIQNDESSQEYDEMQCDRNIDETSPNPEPNISKP